MRVFVALLLLCSTCIGQTITPTKVNVTSGYTNPRVVGPYLLHGDFSLPVSKPGVLLTIDGLTSGQKLFELYAVQAGTDTAADVQSLADGSHLLVGDGKFFVTATFENPTANKRLTVELGPPKPPPNPDPEPEPDPEPSPVPPDAFDNIGQRVLVWSKGLPRRNEVASLYAQLATDLEENQRLTINGAIDKMVAARKVLLKPDELTKYQTLIDQLNGDLKKRWPLVAPVAASYFRAIAAGLGGAK